MSGRATGPLLVLCLLFVGSACQGPSAQPPDARSPEPQPSAGAAAGPVPDFAILDEVRWHASLATLAPGLPPLLTRILGVAAIEEDDGPYEDGSLIWMRDYHPMLVRQANGETRTVAYLAQSQARTTLLNRRRIGEARHALADQQVPLIHENGNLVTNGRLVFVSDRILEENAAERTDAALGASGYRPRRDIIVLPSLPLEETQHVDVWLMFIDERTLIVPQVHEEGVARLTPDERPGAEAVATFLDTQARALARRGLRVVRLPMLPPIIVPANDASQEPRDSEALFLTPANGLLIAHGGKRVVVLPEFDMQALAPHLDDLQHAYERAWEAELAAHGWTVEFVDGTNLVRQLGLVRCVTAPFPQILRSSPPR